VNSGFEISELQKKRHDKPNDLSRIFHTQNIFVGFRPI